jgi:hypothetical protein
MPQSFSSELLEERSYYDQVQYYNFSRRKSYSDNLVSASSASRGITGLGVGGTCFGFGTFVHHDLEANISTCGVLVKVLTGVHSRGIRAVSIPSLEGVEVGRAARGHRVPSAVDLLLGVVVPHLIVVFSVLHVEGSGANSHGGGRGEGGGRCDERGEGNKLELKGGSAKV